MKYLRKPIEAIQRTRNNDLEIIEFSEGKLQPRKSYFDDDNYETYFYLIINGVMHVIPPGDYIIKRQDGSFELCEKEIFEKEYVEI